MRKLFQSPSLQCADRVKSDPRQAAFESANPVLLCCNMVFQGSSKVIHDFLLLSK